eukprot:290744-Pyramimonas_sp.AAC.2
MCGAFRRCVADYVLVGSRMCGNLAQTGRLDEEASDAELCRTACDADASCRGYSWGALAPTSWGQPTSGECFVLSETPFYSTSDDGTKYADAACFRARLGAA